MRTQRRGLLTVLLVGLVALSACATESSAPSSATQPGALAAFAQAFDAGTGHPRLVLLMSPT